MICRCFLLSLDFLFTFLMVSFEAKKFNFDEVQSLFFCASSVISNKLLPNPRSLRFTFIVLTHIFRTFIHFELIFVHGVRKCSNCSFACGYPVVSAPFVGKTITFPLKFLSTLVENHVTINMRAYLWLATLFP